LQLLLAPILSDLLLFVYDHIYHIEGLADGQLE
jgi:hypothetical protein